MNKWLRVALFAAISTLFLLSNIVSVRQYGVASLGNSVNLNEMPEWTSKRALTHLRKVIRDVNGTILSDAYDTSIAGFISSYAAPNSLLFFRNYGGPYGLDAGLTLPAYFGSFQFHRGFRPALTAEVAEHNAFFEHHRRILGGSFGAQPFFDEFLLDPRLRDAIISGRQTYLLESLNPTLYNRWFEPGSLAAEPAIVPLEKVRNFLVPLPSLRGAFEFDPLKKMSWLSEPDAFYPSYRIEALGRYLLFNVINPDSKFRLAMDLVIPSAGVRDSSVPAVRVIGSTVTPVSVVGGGGARIFSPPISAQSVDGLKYIEIDMGRDGHPFAYLRTGLMALFGTKYSFDARNVVAFTHEISIITESDYASLRAPTELTVFPESLYNANLEYSGIYQDGWIGNRAAIWLSSLVKTRNDLVIKFQVPGVGGRLHVNVKIDIDGRTLASRQVNLGENEIRISGVANDGKRHEIRIGASPLVILPGGDERPVSLLLRSIGFKPRATSDAHYETPTGVGLPVSRRPFEANAGSKKRLSLTNRFSKSS